MSEISFSNDATLPDMAHARPCSCGAASLWPWVTTPPFYFGDSGCVSLVSMGVSFAMNLGIALASVFFSYRITAGSFAYKLRAKLFSRNLPIFLLTLFLLPYLSTLTGYIEVDDILAPATVGLQSLALVSGIAGILYHFALAAFCFQTNRNIMLWVGISAALLQIALFPVIYFLF